MKTFIQSYQSDLTPWSLFQRIHSCKESCFFLDSIKQQAPDQNFSYILFDPFLEVFPGFKNNQIHIKGLEKKTFESKNLFNELRRMLKKYSPENKLKSSFFTGGLVGFWGYESVQIFEDIKFREKDPALGPLFYQALFRNIIVYDHLQKKYHFVHHSSEKIKQKKCFDEIKQFFKPQRKKQVVDFRFKKIKAVFSKKVFKEKVEVIKEYIRAGDVYQVNFSQRFDIETSGSKLSLYSMLRKINPSPFSSFLKIKNFEVISSSPERLVSVRNGKCETRPIAGTRPRKRGKTTVGQMQKELLANVKEQAEHVMLIDLERNDLGRVCDWKTVKVEEMMLIEKYSHVMHIVSKIVGKLSYGKDAFDVLQAMFPGGTITGCPKIRCMELIDVLEPVKRGLYTGSLGYIDYAGNMDMNIIIRTLFFEKNRGSLQVGAGIVYDSRPDYEYVETLHKAKALMEALKKASK
jgi:para-aminobenzoate synthetase component 1